MSGGEDLGSSALFRDHKLVANDLVDPVNRKKGSCRVLLCGFFELFLCSCRWLADPPPGLLTHRSHRSNGSLKLRGSLDFLFLERRSCLSSWSGSCWSMVRSFTATGVERGEETALGDGMEVGEAAGEGEVVTERSVSNQDACWWLVVFTFTRDFSPGFTE